jgi:hypothetical protein
MENDMMSFSERLTESKVREESIDYISIFFQIHFINTI